MKNESPHNFFSHLDELRSRLIKSLAAVIVCSCLVYPYVNGLMGLIVRPVGRLVFTSPEEAFSAQVMLSVLFGLIVSLPYVVYQVWSFVAAALTPRERKSVMIFGPMSLVFFLLGISFGYRVILPISLNFLLGFSSSWMVPMITVDKYVPFVGTILLSSGVAFELPLVMVFLARIGIATPEFLRQKRSYVIVIILIIAAILTPPDIVSQILLALPLLFLYEVGVLFCRWAAPGEPQHD